MVFGTFWWAKTNLERCCCFPKTISETYSGTVIGFRKATKNVVKFLPFTSGIPKYYYNLHRNKFPI